MNAGEGTKPKIAVVAKWPVGGIRTWMRDVYSDAVFRKFDITIFVPSGPEVESLESDLKAHEISVKSGSQSSGTFMRQIAMFLCRQRWSLIHSHGFAAGVMATPIAVIRRIPHLITQHDVLLPSQFTDLRGRLIRRIIGTCLAKATLVHSVGHAAAANLMENFAACHLAEENVRIIRNGIDAERFWNAAPIDIRRQYDLPENSFVVGFFGRFMAQKGFRYLVEAIESIAKQDLGSAKPYVLAVGGGGYRAREEREVKARGIAEFFRFVDFTPNIASIIKSVDAVAMPSLWEASGLLAMEVLSAGTPFICSDYPNFLELVADSPARTVRAGSGTDLAAAILSEMKVSSKVAAEDWAKRHRSSFNVQKTALGISELYRELLGSEAPVFS